MHLLISCSWAEMFWSASNTGLWLLISSWIICLSRLCLPLIFSSMWHAICLHSLACVTLEASNLMLFLLLSGSFREQSFLLTLSCVFEQIYNRQWGFIKLWMEILIFVTKKFGSSSMRFWVQFQVHVYGKNSIRRVSI